MPNSVPPNSLAVEAVYGANNVTAGTNAATDPCLPYLQVATFQIFAATTNSRTSAVQVGTTPSGFFAHAAAVPGQQYWYWTRTVDASGAVSDYYPSTTTSTVTATTKTSAGLVLSMSAPAIVLAADVAGTVASFSGATSTAKVMDGNTDATASWSFSASTVGCTVSQAGASFSLTALSADNGYFDVTATRASFPSLLARVMVSKSRTGATGAAGANAQALQLTASSQIFQVTAAGANSPSSITFTATNLGGLTGTPSFAVTSGTATLTGSGSTRTLTYANLGSDTATITATNGSFSDVVTVAKLREGATGAAGVNAVTALLSNEAHTLQAATDGTVSSFTGAATTITIYEGITDTSASWTVTKSDTGVTSTLATRTVTLTAAASDSGFVDITAARSGYTSIVKRFTITKSKAGATGAVGTRGSKHFYVSGRSTWSDTEANTASSPTVLNDVVTQYNSSSFSETKFWNGSVWTTITQAIDGNLLISGSVGATQISASYVYAGNLNASQVNAGTFTGRTFQTASSGQRIVVDASTNYIRAYASNGTEICRFGGATDGSIYSTNDGQTTIPAIYGWSVSNQPAVYGLGSGSGDALRGVVGVGSGVAVSGYCSGAVSSHGMRGTNDYAAGSPATQGGSGILGVTRAGGGYGVYTERGGYGPFTGQHDGLIPKLAEIEPGDIVVDVAVMGTPTITDVITAVERSSVPNQPTCVGVLVSRRPYAGEALVEPPNGLAAWGHAAPDNKGNRPSRRQPDPRHAALPDTYDLVVINSVGEGMLSVCGEGGDIVAGDLITTSSMPGKGMKQANDAVRSYTVGKARQSITFPSKTSVAQIAVIYLCG